MSTRYLYRAYGINIVSDIACPELLEGSHPAQVQIRIGMVPEKLTGKHVVGHKFTAKPGQLLINTDQIAKIMISDGTQMLVEARPGAQDYELRLLLLGWGFSGLPQQRNILPLHGGAVKIGQEALILCAVSQVGKSTLTATFVQEGYPFLDDNIIAIQDVDGILTVIPGYPQIKLWADSLTHLGIEPIGLQPVRLGMQKYSLSFRDMFHDAPMPIGAIYILSITKQPQLNLINLTGWDKLTALSSQVFCQRFVHGLGKGEFQFKVLLNLAQQVPVAQVLIPEHRPSPQDLMDFIMDDYLSRSYETQEDIKWTKLT